MKIIKIFKLALLITTTLLLIFSNCFAMNFSDPISLGSIATLPPYGAFIIEGATSNQGKLSTEKAYKTGHEYAKGIATFGSDDNILYVYYDNSYVYTEDFGENVFRSKELANSCRIGGSTIENTLILPMGFPHSCTIYQVNNDADIKMYLLEYDKGSVPSYKLIGKRQDGKWLKYFETTAAEQYYGMTLAFCHNFSFQNDTIIFEYGRYDIAEKKFVTSIELRFEWNDDDQWFGVNQVEY